MANDVARIRKAYEDTVAVNLKSGSAVTIIPIKSGKKFFCREAWVEVASVSGSGTMPVMEIRGLINGDSAGVIAGPVTLDEDIVSAITVLSAAKASASYWAADLGTQAITFICTTLAGHTTLTGLVHVEGFLY
jgi:hypothetical protein